MKGGVDCYRGRPKALVAIDVNSGRISAPQQNAEQTALRQIRSRVEIAPSVKAARPRGLIMLRFY